MGRVVWIDYGRHRLIVMRDMPRLPAGYRKVGIVWREASTMIPITLHAGGVQRTTLALFDTGSKWSVSLNSKEGAAMPALGTLPALGSRSARKADGTSVKSKVVTLPRVDIAGFGIRGVQADIESSRSTNLPFNILGNDFLKRFDVVIDYRTSELWLKPNSLIDAPYNSVFNRTLAIGAAVAAAVILVVVGVFVRRRSRRRRT
jgi:hypothetical protein